MKGSCVDLKIYELISPRVVSVLTGDSVATAAKLLSLRNIGALPVLYASGALAGMITDRDIVLRCVAAGKNPETTRVGDIMSRRVVSAAPDDDVESAAARMSEAKVRRLPVVENGTLTGILSLGDISRSRAFSMEAARALCDISSNLTHI